MTRLRSAGLLAVVVTGLIAVPGALSAPPSNDNFSTPVFLSWELDERSGTNAEATRENDEPDHASVVGGASVWFYWTAPRDGIVVVDTCDSDFDTLLAIYTGVSVAGLSEVAADDDACGLDGGSGVEAYVIEGTNYRIVVDGVAGETGTFTLWLGMAAPNDDFDSADLLTGPSSHSIGGSTLLTSHEAGEPLHAGSRGTGSVWYEWTAPANARATFETCGQSGGDTLLAVYTGSSVGALTQVAADDDGGCGLSYSKVTFDATAGTTYWIAVDGKVGRQFFGLEWDTGPLVPRNVTRPTISGSPKTNQVLVASPGTWVHASSFSYVWYSCTSPAGSTALCTRITNAGPRMEELRVPTSELGRRIRVAVTAMGPNGISTETSFGTGAVTVGPPVNLVAPEIEGEPLVGRRMTATEGTWDLGGGTRVGVTYRWYVCDETGEKCSDETGPSPDNSYVVKPDDRGALIQVVVTLATSAGSTSVLASALGLVPRPPVAAARCRVPRLVGKTLRAGRASLARSRCRLGKVRRVRSSRRAGVIVAQSLRPGRSLKAGSKVSVRVSLGRRR